MLSRRKLFGMAALAPIFGPAAAKAYTVAAVEPTRDAVVRVKLPPDADPSEADEWELRLVPKGDAGEGARFLTEQQKREFSKILGPINHKVWLTMWRTVPA